MNSQAKRPINDLRSFVICSQYSSVLSSHLFDKSKRSMLLFNTLVVSICFNVARMESGLHAEGTGVIL